VSAAWAKAHCFLNRGGLRPGCLSRADDARARMVGAGSQPARRIQHSYPTQASGPCLQCVTGTHCPRLQVGMGMEPASTGHFSRLFTPSYQVG
jgi:hypothetical protein